MKVIFILCVFLFLNGCTVLTLGASAVSSIVDRYEKYKIEERLEELEKE
tara:strand:+ start:246 stop:392 length:147 start_codon:yes stop_codon:yes gene_type:complete